MENIKIKAPRYSYLLPVPFLLLLIGIVYWGVFIQENEIGTGFRVIAILICISCVFLTIQFIRRFIANPLVVQLDDKGFAFNLDGISTGFITWESVEKVAEVEVLATNASIVGRKEWALGIWLKNPDEYFDKWNLALRKLMIINQKMYGATLLIPIGSLGKEYNRIKLAFGKSVR